MDALSDTTRPAAQLAGDRVMVLYEPGLGGGAAISFGRAMANRDASLTVVCTVPQAPSGSRCGGSAREYNAALVEEVARELEEARSLLGAAAAEARFELLLEGTDPPLAQWSSAQQFDTILLPARRRPMHNVKHPQAARLIQRTSAAVHVVARSARAPDGPEGA